MNSLTDHGPRLSIPVKELERLHATLREAQENAEDLKATLRAWARMWNDADLLEARVQALRGQRG